MLGRVPYAKKKFDDNIDKSRRFEDAARKVFATDWGGADLKMYKVWISNSYDNTITSTFKHTFLFI